MTDLDTAAEVLAAGGVAVIPTETVYGLVCRLDRQDAIDRMFAIKGRSRDAPFQVLFASARDAFEYAHVDAFGRSVADMHMPGPLTLVAQSKRRLPDLGGRAGTIGFRVPDHPLARALIVLCGPLVASSANRSGLATPDTIGGVRSMLGEDVEVYLDGAPAPQGIASTVIDMTVSPHRIVREGAIGRADILRIGAARIV